MRRTENQKIDFVVLWVDSNDTEWKKERTKYSKEIKDLDNTDDREERYRDWDLFKYWFRGVETFAPWVNKVHLVTCGHIPEWLNKDHPKLHIVKHADFMPREALPTFNSNAIELCVHKIPDLAEQFVLFNDDVFITKPVKPTDFFRGGKPLNTMTLFATMPSFEGCSFHKVVNNNISIINKHYSFSEFKKKNILKCLSFKQKEWSVFSYSSLFYNQFIGFRNYHISACYLKSTYSDVWNNEHDILYKTVMSRFRNNEENVNHWLFNYWQFASGNYKQRSSHFGCSIFADNDAIFDLISKQKYHILCINDSNRNILFEERKEQLSNCFNKILGKQSSYEIGGVNE